MLAIGRALMAKPKVLLLDEPSMGLAPMLVAQIFEIITEINEQGTTILLVEQNAAQALQRAHRAYVLEVGAVLISGLAADLHDDPAVKAAYLGGDVAAPAPPCHHRPPRTTPDPEGALMRHHRPITCRAGPRRPGVRRLRRRRATTHATTTTAPAERRRRRPRGPGERRHADGLLRHALRALRVQGRRGKDTGYDMDLLRAIAASADLDMAVIDLPFDGILGSLAAGDCDVVASAVTITDERAEQVDFTEPYFDSDQSLLIKAEERGDITTLADFDGKAARRPVGHHRRDLRQRERHRGRP